MRNNYKYIIIYICFFLLTGINVNSEQREFYKTLNPQEYKIQKSDVLKINIYPDEKQSVQRTVSSLGTISIPLIGNIYVENMNIFEAQDLIRSKLEYYYYNPDVIIEILELDTILVSISGYQIQGESKQNFQFPIGANEPLKILLLRLGWQNNYDSRYSKIIVVRNQRKIIEIDLLVSDEKQIAAQTEIVLNNGDLIFFEKNIIGEVNISGMIKTSGVYYLPKNGVKTLRQLIIEAGGITDNALRTKIKIYRKTINGGIELLFANLSDKIFEDVILNPGDLIEVPALTDEYKKYAVIISDNHSIQIELNEEQPLRLSDIIGKAKLSLKKEYVYTFKITGKDRAPLTIDFDRYLETGDIIYNPVIMEDDIIYVVGQEKFKTENTGYIKVLGNYITPGKYPVYENNRLLDVLSGAGWSQKDAEPTAVVVIDTNAQLKNYDINRYLYFGDISNNPEIFAEQTIYVRPIHKNRVFIVGNVAAPGYYDLDRNNNLNTLARFIFKSGGITEDAAVNRIKIVRENINIETSLNNFLYAQDFSSDVKLRDGDIIYVPATQKFTFYVFGMVDKIGKFDSDAPVTALEALTMAGGYKYTGRLRDAKILRGSPTHPVVIDVNLYDSLNKFASAQNVYLQNGDILYIPKSSVTNVKEFIDEIVPSIHNLIKFGKDIRNY